MEIKSKVNIKPKKVTPYERVLEVVVTYLTENFSELILEMFSPKKEEIKKRILNEIKIYLEEYSLICENMKIEEIVEKIYVDSFEFSFLNKYIFDDSVEEINCNSWDCIIVNYSNGEVVHLDEHFQSPEQALNIVRRILAISNKRINDVEPIALGDIGKNKRITAMIYPIVDEDVYLSFSIRNVHSNLVDKKMFLEKGTATSEMFDFLEDILKYGVSICISGGTGSGKTTITNWLLSTIEDNTRIYTIESGSRELDLIKTDEQGKIINNVVSTITKDNENEKYEVTQDKLLATALRFHPDIICVGEMRDKEAYTAQEAGRTGHTIITTVHADNSIDTYDRILSLCLKANAKIDDKILFKYIVKAFPIIVYVKHLKDKSRKIMDIRESFIDEKGNISFNTIFEYEIEKTEKIDDKTYITGKHVRKNKISSYLSKTLANNGMPTEKLNRFQ